jgi:hypothetical protein
LITVFALHLLNRILESPGPWDFVPSGYYIRLFSTLWVHLARHSIKHRFILFIKISHHVSLVSSSTSQLILNSIHFLLWILHGTPVIWTSISLRRITSIKSIEFWYIKSIWCIGWWLNRPYIITWLHISGASIRSETARFRHIVLLNIVPCWVTLVLILCQTISNLKLVSGECLVWFHNFGFLGIETWSSIFVWITLRIRSQSWRPLFLLTITWLYISSLICSICWRSYQIIDSRSSDDWT